MRSLQDFSLVKTNVSQYLNEDNVTELSNAFYFFAIENILGVNEDEIDECITDNYYLKSQKDHKQGHDLGIDAVYVDENKDRSIVHFFNCKYTDKFDKTENHFPGNEIDKINSFLGSLMSRDTSIGEHVNPVLYSKMEEVWELFDKYSPKFIIHFCSNFYNEFSDTDSKRLTSILNAYSNISVKHHTIKKFVDHLVTNDTVIVNAKIKGIDRNLFEKSDGDVRALIVNVDVRDLLRIVNSNQEFRENPNVSDYSKLLSDAILEEAFEDNVRIYLSQKTKINQNIKQTSLSDDRFHFFYFNNGITITCKKFTYPKGMRAPIIELENLQIVNGSQTIHSLYEAFQTNPEAFEDIDVLCRIYETQNEQLSQDISEFTNSQNPVKSRDVRSNDYFQKILEAELLALDYYYERKKQQYKDKSRNKRIDAETIGQILFAFNNGEPGLAKDNKKEIFGDYYETIFRDDVNADLCLLVRQLFLYIESEKRSFRKIFLENYSEHKDNEYLLHSSLYILYVLGILGRYRGFSPVTSAAEQYVSMYGKAKGIIEKAIAKERDKSGKEVNLRVFFKGNKAKKSIDLVLDEEGITLD